MIKAIETKYKGYRFRSRLEAKWAVFFDVLGIDWEYEKEGFDLGNVWYLPDFWLSKVGMWVEIKPTNVFTKEDLIKGIKFQQALDSEYIENKINCSYRIAAGNPCYYNGKREYSLYKVDCWETGGVFSYIKQTFNGDNLMKAYQAARSARFEHSESG